MPSVAIRTWGAAHPTRCMRAVAHGPKRRNGDAGESTGAEHTYRPAKLSRPTSSERDPACRHVLHRQRIRLRWRRNAMKCVGRVFRPAIPGSSPRSSDPRCVRSASGCPSPRSPHAPARSGDHEVGVRHAPPRALRRRLASAELGRGRQVQAQNGQGREKLRHQRDVLLRRPGSFGTIGKLRRRDPSGCDIIGDRSPFVDDLSVAAKYLNADVRVEDLQSSISRPPEPLRNGRSFPECNFLLWRLRNPVLRICCPRGIDIGAKPMHINGEQWGAGGPVSRLVVRFDGSARCRCRHT